MPPSLANPAPSWQQRLTRAWLTRNALSRALWPLSLVYGALVALRAWRHRGGRITSQRMPVPVVIVGNVVVGGAGKTPTTVAIVRHLKAMGHRPGVVSRGYGRHAPGPGTGHGVVHVCTETPAELAGDEPLLIHHATQVPVVVADQRVQAAQALLAAHPDTTVLVCDDGLQHLALHADVAIAVFDERGLGNGWLLPAGLLREPWPTPKQPNRGPTRTIHLVLQAHALGRGVPLPCPDRAQHAWAHKHLAHEAVGVNGERVALADLLRHTDLPWAACAGIANPSAFFAMLRAAGATLNLTLPLNDHQNFNHLIDSELFNNSKRYSIFCTEKDAVKLFPLLRAAAAPAGGSPATRAPPQVWAVPLVFAPEPAFFEALDQQLSSRHGHQTA